MLFNASCGAAGPGRQLAEPCQVAECPDECPRALASKLAEKGTSCHEQVTRELMPGSSCQRRIKQTGATLVEPVTPAHFLSREGYNLRYIDIETCALL